MIFQDSFFLNTFFGYIFNGNQLLILFFLGGGGAHINVKNVLKFILFAIVWITQVFNFIENISEIKKKNVILNFKLHARHNII